MTKIVRFGVAAALIACGCEAGARTHTGTENINGYDVQFVDTGAAPSDEFSVSFSLALGRLSEGGEFIGRARLLEKTIATQLPEGAEAFTGLGATLFVARGRTRDAQTLVSGMLAPFRGLEWSEETFARMRAQTVAEASGRMPLAEEDYLIAMMYAVLLPKRHVWSVTPLGDADALARMSLDSIRSYFTVNYRAENVRIQIRGDFSTPEVFDNVKLWITEALTLTAAEPRTSLEPLSPAWAPSLFADRNAPVESERLLYVASGHERISLAVLEGDLRELGEEEAVEKLVERLNAEPFAERAFFYTERIGDKVHLIFAATPTAAGAEDLNFEAFRRLRAEQRSYEAARLFHPARALYAEMGPALEEMDADPRFGRAYLLIDNRAAVRRYSRLFNDAPDESAECTLRLLPPGKR